MHIFWFGDIPLPNLSNCIVRLSLIEFDKVWLPNWNSLSSDVRHMQGFWYFAEKKAKFRGIFRGKFAEKSAAFAGFSQEKSQNSQKNQPISRILVEKIQIWKIFSGKFLEKSADFTGNFGGNFAKKQSVKNSQFWQIFFGKFR